MGGRLHVVTSARGKKFLEHIKCMASIISIAMCVVAVLINEPKTLIVPPAVLILISDIIASLLSKHISVDEISDRVSQG